LNEQSCYTQDDKKKREKPHKPKIAPKSQVPNYSRYLPGEKRVAPFRGTKKFLR
jgi:hypothetical protein